MGAGAPIRSDGYVLHVSDVIHNHNHTLSSSTSIAGSRLILRTAAYARNLRPLSRTPILRTIWRYLPYGTSISRLLEIPVSHAIAAILKCVVLDIAQPPP